MVWCKKVFISSLEMMKIENPKSSDKESWTEIFVKGSFVGHGCASGSKKMKLNNPMVQVKSIGKRLNHDDCNLPGWCCVSTASASNP